MAIVFVIPGPLRDFAGNRSEIAVSGSARTIGEALDLLMAESPAVRDRIVTELGTVRPHVNIFIDGENIRYAKQLDTPVRDGAEVLILPALSGG